MYHKKLRLFFYRGNYLDTIQHFGFERIIFDKYIIIIL